MIDQTPETRCTWIFFHVYVCVCVCASRDTAADHEGCVIDGQGIDFRVIRYPATEDTSNRIRDPDHGQQVC